MIRRSGPESLDSLEERMIGAYERRGRDLLAFAYRLLGSAAAAEDVVHDAFLRLLDGRCRLDDARGEIELLLFGVVRNVAREQHKRTAHEQRRSEPRPGEDLAATGTIPEHVLAVRAALGRLSESDREVIVLSAYHGYTPKEIAVALGSTALVVRVRLHRARGRLRADLLNGGFGASSLRMGARHE